MSHTILIVDDSRTVRAVLRRTIGLTGIPVGKIYDASNGREALDLLDEFQVDIVLTDVHMPVMGGVELVETMRDSEHFAALPVVVISSDASQGRRDQLHALGVRAVLTKPFSAESIRDTLGCALGRQSRG